MKVKDIKIDGVYQHKDHVNMGLYCHAKEILRPHFGENKTGATIIKVVLSQDKNCSWGITKYFKASNLVKISE